MSGAVLATGATGTVGSAVVEELLRAGEPVRAATQHPDRYPGGGAEPVRFDFADPATLEPAFEGVDRLFLLRPPAISDVRTYLRRGGRARAARPHDPRGRQARPHRAGGAGLRRRGEPAQRAARAPDPLPADRPAHLPPRAAGRGDAVGLRQRPAAHQRDRRGSGSRRRSPTRSPGCSGARRRRSRATSPTPRTPGAADGTTVPQPADGAARRLLRVGAAAAPAGRRHAARARTLAHDSGCRRFTS